MRDCALVVLIVLASLTDAQRMNPVAKREKSMSFARGGREEATLAMMMLAYKPVTFGRVHAFRNMRSDLAPQMSTNFDDRIRGGIKGLSRRSALSNLPAASAILGSSVGGVRAASAAVALETYTNKFFCVSFGVPKGWEAIEKAMVTRVLVGSVDPKDPEFQVTMLFTPIAADYQSLGAFGNIDYVATSTVIPPGSIASGDLIEGKLLGQEVLKGNYVYDYTLQSVNRTMTSDTLLPKRHLRTLFAVLPGGETRATSTLVTLTAQCLDSKYVEYEPIMKAIVESYEKLGGLGLECPARTST